MRVGLFLSKMYLDRYSTQAACACVVTVVTFAPSATVSKRSTLMRCTGAGSTLTLIPAGHYPVLGSPPPPSIKLVSSVISPSYTVYDVTLTTSPMSTFAPSRIVTTPAPLLTW